VGIFVSGLAGSAMANYGWHAQPSWVWSAVLALACSVLIWRISGRVAPSTAVSAPASSKPDVSGASGSSDASGMAGAPGSADASGWAIPGYLVAGHILAYGMEGFGYIITATFMPVMADHALPGADGQALLWPLFGLCVAIGALGATRLPVRWNHCKMLAAAYLLQCVGILCTIFWLDITGFAVGSILLGVPFTIITLYGMREARRLGGARGVQLMAAMTACYALGQIIGPPLATHLVALTGGFNAALGVAAFILFAGAMLYIALYLRENRVRVRLATQA
jgi:MFS family permease